MEDNKYKIKQVFLILPILSHQNNGNLNIWNFACTNICGLKKSSQGPKLNLLAKQ